MFKYIFKLSCFVMICMLTGLVYSCKEEDEKIDGPVIDEKEVEKTLNSASVEWGASLEKVSRHMDGYTLVTSQNNDFLMFSNNLLIASYAFLNGFICTTSSYTKCYHVRVNFSIYFYTNCTFLLHFLHIFQF